MRIVNGDGFCIADTSSCNCLNSPDITLGYDPNMDNADSKNIKTLKQITLDYLSKKPKEFQDALDILK